MTTTQTITGFSETSAAEAIANAMKYVEEIAESGRGVVINLISCTYNEEKQGYVAEIKITVKTGRRGKKDKQRKYVTKEDKKYLNLILGREASLRKREEKQEATIPGKKSEQKMSVQDLLTGMTYLLMAANARKMPHLKTDRDKRFLMDFFYFASRFANMTPNRKLQLAFASRALVRNIRAYSSDGTYSDTDNDCPILSDHSADEVETDWFEEELRNVFPGKKNVFVPFSQSATFPGVKKIYYQRPGYDDPEMEVYG